MSHFRDYPLWVVAPVALRPPVIEDQQRGLLLPAAQLSVIVLDFAAPLIIPQRGVFQFAVLFLATGLERIAANADVLAGLRIRTVGYATVVSSAVSIAVPVVVAIIVGVMAAAAITIVTAVAALSVAVAAGALQASVQVLNFSVATLIVLELCGLPVTVRILTFGVQR